MHAMSSFAVRVAVGVAFATASVVANGAPVAATGDAVIKVSAGGYQTCALKSGGNVWCWGWDIYGQVGDRTRGDLHNDRLNPVQVRQGTGHLTGVAAIGTGELHSCAVKTDGSAWCWGYDSNGQLGDGTTGDATNHLRLNAVQVRHGSGFLTGVTAISGGLGFTCALRHNGTAWCWGSDFSGQVGDGTTGDSRGLRLKAVQVRRGSGFLTGVTGIATGSQHACARTSDGAVWCWGAADSGQVGDGTTGNGDGSRLKAVRVRTANGVLSSVRGVTAGDSHSCAWKSDGSAWCWGRDLYGELGDGTTGGVAHRRLFATRVSQGTGYLSGVTGIDGGGDHTCARTSDASVWCWGWDKYGQLGDGTTGNANEMRLKPVRVVDGKGGRFDNASSVSAGRIHSCAVRSDQTAWCWGDDGTGQGGDGVADPNPHTSPVQVVFL